MRVGNAMQPILIIAVLTLLSLCSTSASGLHHRQRRQLAVTCLAPGFQPHPSGDSSMYVQCVMIGGRWYYYVYRCPAGSGFDPSRNLCVVGFTSAPSSTTAATTEATTGADTTTMATTGADTTTMATTGADTTTMATTGADTTTMATTGADTTTMATTGADTTTMATTGADTTTGETTTGETTTADTTTTGPTTTAMP